MSLPDATRSDRIYPLLQNLDLENLAFATLQGTGETLNIEEMNEDELRRLVLVNLARLTVKGEWDGLLSAGGGGGGIVLPGAEVDNPSTYKYWDVMSTPPYGQAQKLTTAKMDGKGTFFPFVASQSGTLTGMKFRVTGAHSGGNMYAGIYSADEDTGLPKTLAGYCTFSTTSVATVEQTSFSSSITTVRGTVYWMYCNVDNATTASNATFYGMGNAGYSAGGPSVTGGPYETPSNSINGIGFRYNSATYGVPAATVTTANLEGNSPFGGTSTGNPPTILLAWT
jgi:hypothetical protein